MLKQLLVRRLEAAVAACLAEGAFQVESVPPVALERPRDARHGDFSSNLALLLARPAGQAPVAIARAIASRMRPAGPLAAVEVAMPGYLNMRLSDEGLVSAFEAVMEREPTPGGRPLAPLSPDELLEARQWREPAHMVGRFGVPAEAAADPLFYVGYAHARMAAILRSAADEGEAPEAPGGWLDLRQLEEPEARELLVAIGCVDDDWREAAAAGSPHRLVRSALDLATAFYRFVSVAPAFAPEPDVREARLLLLAGARRALARVLVEGLGLAAPESLDQGLLLPISEDREPRSR